MTADAAKRRIRRIALDLHDGPLQSAALLEGEIRLLRSQIEAALQQPNAGAILVGRLDDLHARIAQIQAEMREIVVACGVGAAPPEGLVVALEQLAATFRTRSGVEIDVELSGELDDLTPSQQLAIFRIVQEALSNVHEHAQASHVQVAVHRGEDGVRTEVVDDGAGFAVGSEDPDRIGLAGMRERAEMLGGTLSIESRVGGPTRVVAALPPWRAREPHNSSSAGPGPFSMSITTFVHGKQ